MSLPIQKTNTPKEDKQCAKKVWFEKNTINVQLTDDRVVCVPLDLYPLLLDAPKRVREDFRLFKEGKVIHFNELDKDVSVDALVCGQQQSSDISKKKNVS